MATERAKNLSKRIVEYPEDQPSIISSKDWVHNLARDPKDFAVQYLRRLFPILGWITRYNVGWLTGDIIAGLTVGMVLVPQSMSYATIATLPPEYGLYSAFVGVMTYCLFATSKDVSIGPVAVMSLQVSQIIKYIDQKHPNEWSGPEIATNLAFVCGFIVLGIGLLRLGWLVELIPVPAVAGFMTGSAINITVGQVPGLMGITGFDTRAATYHVVINTLKGLGRTKKDAAFGLVALFFLYAIRMTCDYLSRRYPRRARIFFFVSAFRSAFVIVVLTFASWLYTRHRRSAKGTYPIKILQTVPRGLKHVGAPHIDSQLLSALAPKLPVATIILLLEHIAIAKSFGRINGYKIDPNQELVAIGVTNTVGTAFGAYPATGSFSRSALKAKSGVRTPAAGILSGIIVLVALYGLTSAFFWIPTAGLSAVIIHAVADLVTKPPQVYKYWRISPLEFFIWVAAVLVTIFSTIENGIYVSLATSGALLIFRLAHPRGRFLGRVRVHANDNDTSRSRDVFVPLANNHVINPQIRVEPPLPGVLVYRLEETFLYPNCSVLNSEIVDYVRANIRRGADVRLIPLSDRPWNDPGSRRGADSEWEENQSKPVLHSVVLDFSTASQVDTTSVQALIDTRKEIERWTDHPVEFHFASILSPWIRRSLVAAGFGYDHRIHSARPHDVAAIVPYDDPETRSPVSKDVEAGDSKGTSLYDNSYGAVRRGEASTVQTDTPYFHLDLAEAVAAAEASLLKLSPSTSSNSVGK